MFRSRINWQRIALVTGIVLVLGILVWIDFRIKFSLLAIAGSRVQVKGVEMINRVINEKIVSQIEYQDIVLVHKDETGKIVLIQPNTIMLNQIMSRTLMEVTDYMGQLQNETIEIPAGELTGSKLLAGYGPKMRVKVIPTGQVHINVLNKFDQAGINQTRHLIYFEVKNKMKIAVPFFNDEIQVSSTIPLAETIIVGDVPETYVDFKGESQMLYPFITSP